MTLKYYSTCIFIFLLTFLGCTNFYDFNKVKNLNSKKKFSAFRSDKKKCENRAVKLSRNFDASIFADADKSSKNNLYVECMKRRGWRLR